MKAIALIYTVVLLAIVANSNQGRHWVAMALLKERPLQQPKYTPSPYGAAFDSVLIESALELEVPASWLVEIFKAESGYIHTARNKHSGAFGLIQFLPSTLNDLGSSVRELRTLPAVAQLPLVVKYYKGKSFTNLTDMRLYTFYPAALGKDDTWPIGGAQVARQNPIYDLDGSGQITVGEFKQYYAQKP